MKSRIFSTSAYQDIERAVLDLLNARQSTFSADTQHSTRATGDAIESILRESFAAVLGEWSKEYSAGFARRAMADIAFTDVDGLYYVVDVKTHRVDTRFNMPNLTSVERLARFYEDDANCFALLFISYRMVQSQAQCTQVRFMPIEFLSWNCLTIGALGWGQIQIADSNRIEVVPGQSRKKWMLELCDTLAVFYPREIAKIEARIGHFGHIRGYWESKPDD